MKIFDPSFRIVGCVAGNHLTTSSDADASPIECHFSPSVNVLFLIPVKRIPHYHRRHYQTLLLSLTAAAGGGEGEESLISIEPTSASLSLFLLLCLISIKLMRHIWKGAPYTCLVFLELKTGHNDWKHHNSNNCESRNPYKEMDLQCIGQERKRERKNHRS